jgi:hypothetical protein
VVAVFDQREAQAALLGLGRVDLLGDGEDIVLCTADVGDPVQSQQKARSCEFAPRVCATGAASAGFGASVGVAAACCATGNGAGGGGMVTVAGAGGMKSSSSTSTSRSGWFFFPPMLVEVKGVSAALPRNNETQVPKID